MKTTELLRELFESDDNAKALEDWLDLIEKKWERSLLTAPVDELIKAKHQYDAAKRYRADFMSFFDKQK